MSPIPMDRRVRDDGSAVWRTTATREQVEAVKASGLYRPSLPAR
jgi:hypothetical protein